MKGEKGEADVGRADPAGTGKGAVFDGDPPEKWRDQTEKPTKKNLCAVWNPSAFCGESAAGEERFGIR